MLHWDSVPSLHSVYTNSKNFCPTPQLTSQHVAQQKSVEEILKLKK